MLLSMMAVLCVLGRACNLSSNAKPMSLSITSARLHKAGAITAVPVVLTELNQYVNYTNDASKLPIPLEHSKNVSPKGTKVLYSGEF